MSAPSRRGTTIGAGIALVVLLGALAAALGTGLTFRQDVGGAGAEPAAAAPVVPGQVVVDESFGSGRLPRGWRAGDGRWWVSGGRLHAVAAAPARPARVLFGRALTDFRFEATVRMPGPDRGWAALGLDVPRLAGPRGATAGLRAGPSADTLAFAGPDALTGPDPDGAVRLSVGAGAGRDVRVTIEVHGERARWFAGGRQVARSVSLTRAGGLPGLLAGPAEVTFDDVRITALAPEPLLRAPGTPPAVIAHRGASDVAPENTLASGEAARAAGADWIENDVQPSADGVPHVLHDPTVDRTTHGTGPIRSLTSDQIAALDAGAWFGPAFTGQRVPTLAAQLADLRTRGGRLLLEIKGTHTRDEVARIMDVVRAEGMLERVVVQSFDAGSLRYVRELAPGVPLALLVMSVGDDPVATARELGLAAYNPSDQALSARPEIVAALHAAGVAVMVWTVDRAERWAALDEAGVDAIITNRPADLGRFLADRPARVTV